MTRGTKRSDLTFDKLSRIFLELFAMSYGQKVLTLKGRIPLGWHTVCLYFRTVE